MPENAKEKLHRERRGSVMLLWLDDPSRRNALSVEMAAELVAAVERAEADDEVRAVVVTGEPPAFCAGADLSHLESADGTGLRAVYDGFSRLVSCTKLTVAAVNGAAVGAGMNLALACDVRVAAERARFDTRFLSLGLHPGGGHTWMLERAVGYQAAAALLLGGQVVSGAEAQRIGLAYRLVADDAVVDEAVALAEGAGAASPELLRRTKRSLAAVPERTYEEALESELADQLWSTRQPEFAERVASMRRSISSKGGDS